MVEVGRVFGHADVVAADPDGNVIWSLPVAHLVVVPQNLRVVEGWILGSHATP